MTTNADTSDQARPNVSGLNWGALGLTPLWLVRNGFWITAIVYFVLLYYAWPLTFVVSLIFFLRGTRWSWGNGARWKNYETFADSQFAWGFCGIASLILQAMWVVFQWLNVTPN